MEDRKPLVIGLLVVALLLFGFMFWKYMMPHSPPPGTNEPFVPGAAQYGPGGGAPPAGQYAPPAQPMPGQR